MLAKPQETSTQRPQRLKHFPSRNREVMKHWRSLKHDPSCKKIMLQLKSFGHSVSHRTWALMPRTTNNSNTSLFSLNLKSLLTSTSGKEKGWKRCKCGQEAYNVSSKRALQHTVTISSSKTFSVCLWFLQVSCLLHFVQRARMGRFAPSIDIHIGQVYGWKNDNTYPAPG